jgi:hypothetical protein
VGLLLFVAPAARSGDEAFVRFLLVIALASCAGTVAPPRPSTPQQDKKQEKKATLFYSDKELAPGRTFPSPLARGTVHGKPTVFIVDTGAQVSVIDASLAESAGVEIGAGVAAADPSGNAVAMRRADHPAFGVDGLGLLSDRPAAVVALPTLFTQIGVGAILSPQSLADGQHSVVVDLAHDELRITDAPTTATATATANGSAHALLGTSLCPYVTDGLAAKALVARASIDGVSTVVEIDTGASGTFVVAESDVGRKLSSRTDATHAKAMGAAGPIDIARIANARASSGPVTLDGPLAVMPGGKDEHCGYDGRLGIDRLRACTLFIGEKTLEGVCGR